MCCMLLHAFLGADLLAVSTNFHICSLYELLLQKSLQLI